MEKRPLVRSRKRKRGGRMILKASFGTERTATKTTFGTEKARGKSDFRYGSKNDLWYGFGRAGKEGGVLLKTTFGTGRKENAILYRERTRGKTTSGTGFMTVKQLYFTDVKTTFGTAFAGKSVPNDIFPYYILYMVSRNKTSFFAKKEASFQKKTERCPLKVGKIKTPSCRFQKWEEFFRRVWWR